MSRRDDGVYLQDMLESITAIESFLDGCDNNAFVGDRKTYSATLRELEVIGEAAGRISESLKELKPEIDWRTLKDFRNVLAHEYFGVNADIVWDIVQNKLQPLKCLLEMVLHELGTRK